MILDFKFALVERICIGTVLITVSTLSLLAAGTVVSQHGTPPSDFGQQLEYVSWFLYALIFIGVGYKPTASVLSATANFVRRKVVA